MNTARSKLSVSSENYYTVTLALNWILLKWRSSVKKVKAQLLSLIQHMETFWMWIVNYGELWNEDRQFFRTVYVISWTVNTALSTKRAKLWVCDMCLYHSKTLLVKQGTFLHELWPDSAEKGDVLNTGNLDISGIWYWKSVYWWIVYHQWKQNIGLFE